MTILQVHVISLCMFSVFFYFNSLLPPQVIQLCPINILQSNSVTSLDTEEETTPAEQASPTTIDEDLSVMLHDSVTMVIQSLCKPMELLLSKLTKHDPRDGFFNSLMMMVSGGHLPHTRTHTHITHSLHIITHSHYTYSHSSPTQYHSTHLISFYQTTFNWSHGI